VTTAAALTFALVAAGAVGFQLGLALGAPWGSYAMAGRYPGAFPPRLRVVAVIQAALLVFLAIVVLSDGGVALPSIAQAAPWMIWAPVAFSVVSLVLNAITPSAGERRIWVPVALAMLASSLVVALS
jgi:hypothetical protein